MEEVTGIMSADCLFVLRSAKNTEKLIDQLAVIARTEGYGVRFDLKDALLTCSPLVVEHNDLVLFLCDSENSYACELLLGYDDMRYDGVFPSKSLIERMQFIQKMVHTCLLYSQCVEVFISDDNPCLEDYVSYDLITEDVAKVLVREYIKEDKRNVWLPCVHLTVFQS